MHLGFVDGQGRVYDLTFRTTKRRIRDAGGEWTLEPGEAIGASIAVWAEMFLGDEQRPLLRATPGTAFATDRRLLFLAGDAVERTPEEPTAFRVSIRASGAAVDHLFRKAGGREVVEVRKADVKDRLETNEGITLRIEAPWLGKAEEHATFLLGLRPASAAHQAVAPIGL